MAQYDVNLREYWRIIRKRKFIVLFIAAVIGVFSTAFAIFSAPTPLYSTASMIEIKRDRLIEGIYSKTIEWDDSDDIETQIAVIKSYAVFEKVAEQMGLIPRSSSSRSENQIKNHVIAAIENLQSKVEVTRLKFSSILSIAVTDPSPAFAQRLANTVSIVYRELHAEQQTKRTREALRYIEDQMRDVRERLRGAEERYNRFSKENELISIDLQSENLLKQTKDGQSELAKIEEEKTELGNLLGRLKQFIRNPVGSDHNFDSIKASARYQSANDALVGLLLKRETLLKDFTPRHPEVVAISNEISETARKMAYMLDLQLKSLETKQTESSKGLEKLDQKTKALLDKKLEHGRLKREVELYTEMTALLERKNQEALIRRSEKPEEVNIVKPALLPAIPINPPQTAATGAMGVIIGIVLGLIIAFVVETFDTSLGAIEDVEQTLEIPVLGVIPHVDLKTIQENIKERYSGRIHEHAIKQAVNLISHFVPKSMMAESFRGLRTNIHFKDTEKKIRSLAFTSTSPQEGKTLIALNTAITMAQSGIRTLLVGSDLRKPMLARIFGVPPSPGLSDILLGNCEWRDTVRGITDVLMGEISLDEIMISPGLDNFFFIVGGTVPPNPAELIQSQRIDRFIEEAKAEYDMILFDTAPILSAADPAILGTKVDAVLLVYRIGTVPKGLLKRAIKQMTQVKSNVIGVILNGMRPEVSPDFENYKHYKYYYSYGEDAKKQKHKKTASRDSQVRGADESTPAQALGWFKKGRYNLKSALWISLLIPAFALLAIGLLWQNNTLDLFSSGNKEVHSRKQDVNAPVQPESTAVHPQEDPSASMVHKPLPPDVSRPQDPPRDRPQAPSGVDQTIPQTSPQKALQVADLSSAQETGSQRLENPSSEENNQSPPAALTEEVPKKPEEKPLIEEPKGETPDPVVIAQPERIESQTPPEEKQTVLTGRISAEFFSEGRYPFSVYLGSVARLDHAEEGVLRYQKSGIPAYSTEVELGKGIWYRIYAGHFRTEQQAQRFKEEKKLEEAEVKKTPFTDFIGTFTSEDELQTKIRVLKDLGFSPYVFKEADGKEQLLVGAFRTEEGVKRQHQQLLSKGIGSRIVRR